MDKLSTTFIKCAGSFLAIRRSSYTFAYSEEKEVCYSFGSLLRSFRVNKSTNQLMCRDLNGRRLASIDEEQKLKKWIERAAEREKEKIAKRNAKYEKLKSGPPKHMFNDPDYIRQKETIIEKTEEAFEQGFVEFLKEEQEKKNKPVVESSSDSDFDIDDLPGSLRNEKKMMILIPILKKMTLILSC
ncbi:unnamed protein product [Cylicostephanus goldi]|uniref:SDE2-like domain-containing protein n=1 Tax=Cylicostephanus goldi TaxID=71465 RepID=A0A3P6S8V3_CYLGO|nr:unnamed protein product [Cylicostephanus goldi]